MANRPDSKNMISNQKNQFTDAQCLPARRAALFTKIAQWLEYSPASWTGKGFYSLLTELTLDLPHKKASVTVKLIGSRSAYVYVSVAGKQTCCNFVGTEAEVLIKAAQGCIGILRNREKEAELANMAEVLAALAPEDL